MSVKVRTRREAWLVRHVYPWVLVAGIAVGIFWGHP